MKWLKRILITLLILILLPILFLAGFIIYDANTSVTAAEFTNMQFTDAEGNTHNGYLAQPEGPGPHPGILLIHEWWGMNAGIPILADALAAEGYVVLAADALQGRSTSSVPRALWMAITTPEEKVFADVDAALAHLLSMGNVDTERVASMGFCFGGGHSLQLGLRQSQSLALTVIYYGAVVTEPELLRPLVDGQPVLGIFAEEDQQILPEEVLEFEAALNSLEIDNQITIYEGVGHGFLNEENYKEPGPAGDAWQETLAFLEETLKR